MATIVNLFSIVQYRFLAALIMDNGQILGEIKDNNKRL